MTDKSDKRNAIISVGSILAIALIGFSIFLFSKDEGGITGIQALKQAGSNFWIWAILITIVSSVVFWLFLKIYNKTKDFGATRTILLASLAFISIAWGKGCDIKESKGVTSEKGRVGGPPPVDTTRIPAEDLISR